MNDEKDLVSKHLQYAQPQPVSARKAAPIAPAETLDELRVLVEGCTKCDLCETRTKIVFGSGNPHARILVIGEAPGKNEDLQGEPFVGAAGKFLNELLEDAGLKREDIFIANVLKCRPPANRNPQPHEIEACAPYLRAQTKIINPDVIVTLGNFATQFIRVRRWASRACAAPCNRQGAFWCCPHSIRRLRSMIVLSEMC